MLTILGVIGPWQVVILLPVLFFLVLVIALIRWLWRKGDRDKL